MFKDPRGEVLFKCQMATDTAIISKSFFDIISRDIESDSSNFVIKFLRNIKGFSKLSTEEVRRIAAKVQYKKYDINTLVLRQGDIPGYAYFLLFGGVKLVR